MSIGPLATMNVLLSGMQTAQEESDLASENIAGASDTNYAEETAVVVALPGSPLPMASGTEPGGTYDAGVEVQSIAQQAPAYLAAANNAQQAQSQYASTYQSYLSSAQDVYQEPGSDGLSSVMDTFFNSLTTLSQDPSDTGAQSAVVGNAQTVAQTFNTLATQLQTQSTNASTQLTDQIPQDNSLLTSLAQINQSIAASQMAGESPSALLDQQSGIVSQLAQDLGAVVSSVPVLGGSGQPVTTANGTPVTTIDVSMPDGTPLVSGFTAGSIAVTAPASGSSAPWSLSVTEPDTSGSTTPTTATPVLTGTQGGTAGALLTLLNGALSGDGAGSSSDSLLNQLDSVAQSLSTQVNDLQVNNAQNTTPSSNTAYATNPTTGAMQVSTDPLFTSTSGSSSTAASTAGITAANLTVNSALVTSPSLLATAQSDNANDGSNAAAMAALETAPDGATSQFASDVAQLGTTVNDATQNQTTQSALAAQTQQSWQSVAGVNINQEVSNLMVYSQQYTSLAKGMSTVQSMMSALIDAVQ